MGNDWLLHVLAGTYFTYTFGWKGIPFAFAYHFPIDMIPHGHVKNDVKDALKGMIVAAAIGFYTWHAYDFKKAFMVGMGILAAIFFDLVLWAAFWADKKKIWEKFGALSGFIRWVVKIIIQLNYAIHWFGWIKWFRNLWKDPKVHNCGTEGNGLRVSWLNIIQLVVAIAVFAATYRHF